MPSRSSTESSATTTRTGSPPRPSCPRPRRAGDLEPAVERGDAVREPAQAGAAGGIGAADAVVARRSTTTVAVDARARATARACASRVPGDVGERLGDDEVGGRLDAGGSRSAGARDLDRYRRARPASASTAARRPRSLSTAGWMPRASSRSSAVACSSSAIASSSSAAPAVGVRRRAGLRASRRSSASATSRCWAPSWRSRSSRRRSASAAWTIRAREAPQLLDPRAQRGLEPLVLERQRRPRRRPRRRSRRSIAERGIADQRADRATVVLDDAGQAALPRAVELDRVPRVVDPAAARRAASRRAERGVAERVGEHVARGTAARPAARASRVEQRRRPRPARESRERSRPSRKRTGPRGSGSSTSDEDARPRRPGRRFAASVISCTREQRRP